MSPIAIVIIHRQNPEKIITALMPHMPIVLSYDTPTIEEWKNAEDIAKQYPSVKITRFDRAESGFFAGANRNNGLLFAIKNYSDISHYFFFDGDRVPDELDVSYIENLLNQYAADCCLFTCKDGDKRAIARTELDYGIVDTGCMVSDFYSCGFVLSDKACKQILNINNGLLFHSEFNGIWGEEDKFLGIQLDNLGFKTIFSHKPLLGGKPLTNADLVTDYGISLQRRITLMQKYGYPMRPFDKYERLTFVNNIPISIYIGESSENN